METEAQLRELGWSAAEAKEIAALPVTVRFFDYENCPLSAAARWYRDYPMDLEVRAWQGSSSWPYPEESWWRQHFLAASPRSTGASSTSCARSRPSSPPKGRTSARSEPRTA
jgi:hypothetical protein